MPNLAEEVLAAAKGAGALGAAVATRDGIPIRNDLPPTAFAEAVCAMAAASLAASETAFDECGVRDVNALEVRADGAAGVILPLDERMLLVAVLSHESDTPAFIAAMRSHPRLASVWTG